MKAHTSHRRLWTLLVCVIAYGMLFASVNTDVIGRSVMEAPKSPEKSASIDPEAQFDEDYFNSPQVNRAMSLNDPEPYRALNDGSALGKTFDI